MKKVLEHVCDDLALFGVSCSLALTTWAGLLLFLFYALALVFKGDEILGSILLVWWVFLVGNKNYTQTKIVLKEDEDDD